MTTGPGRGTRIAIGLGGLACGAAAAAALVWGGYSVPPELAAPTIVLNLSVGWSFIGVGIVASVRRPDNRTGLLMIIVGFAYLSRFVIAVRSDAAFALGVLVSSLYLSVLVHLIVTFPTGRLATWPQRIMVGFGYLLSVPLDALFLILVGVRLAPSDGLPPLGLVIVPQTSVGSPDLVDVAVQVAVLAALAGALCIVANRWRRAGAAERRAIGPALLGGVLIIATLFLQRSVFILQLDPEVRAVVNWSFQMALVLWPLALGFGLIRSQLDRSGVGRMIVQLGGGQRGPDDLRAALAATLHDPSVEVGYWLPDRDQYVDSLGRPVDVAVIGPGRAVTSLERDGSRIAVLVHDAALIDEPELVQAVAAGVGLALENERLHAEVRAQLRDVRESRARIVESADAARRQVERDLHDGAQQRLVTVALRLQLATIRLDSAPTAEIRVLLDQTAAELTEALADLRELARGIYPVLLSHGGLVPALTALADRSPIPTVVRADLPSRLPDRVEQTGYFIVSEALANASKHAAAGSVAVDLSLRNGSVILEVFDDGSGGADAGGSGLRGLADRVAAVGGRLRIDSPVGVGTRLTAELPAR